MKNEKNLVTHGCQSLSDIQCVPMDGMSACDLSRNTKTFQQNVPSTPEIRNPSLQFWPEFIETKEFRNIQSLSGHQYYINYIVKVTYTSN